MCCHTETEVVYLRVMCCHTETEVVYLRDNVLSQ